MFGKKKMPRPAFDVTQKVVKTWWGGKKWYLLPRQSRK